MITQPQELVLAATIHRVKMCEDKIREFEQMVSTLTSQMAQNRTEMASKEAGNIVLGVTTPLDIPKELVVTYGKYRARGNRKYDVVKKRWAIWKAQYNSGLSLTNIAKAWGCHHTTILNAVNRNFTPRKATGRGKK
jgi:hypothetical protein